MIGFDEHCQLKWYRQLMEDLHDLAVEAERRDQEPISLNETAAGATVGGHGAAAGDGAKRGR
jgi:S-formylglutathione hydrolase FrmB